MKIFTTTLKVKKTRLGKTVLLLWRHILPAAFFFQAGAQLRTEPLIALVLIVTGLYISSIKVAF